MRVRKACQAAMLVILFMVTPAVVRTLDNARIGPASMACDSGPPRIDAERAATLSEEDILAYLATPETDHDEIARLLESLGRFDRSHTAIATLIYWLVFQHWEEPKKGDGIKKPDGVIVRWNPATSMPPQPVVESLKRIGMFAIPHLVEESVFFFENTSIAAAMSRHGGLQGDRHGNIFQVQRQNGYRISCLRCILHNTPETSALAAECAWNLMEAKPDDDRVQRACRNICMQLQQIHWDERKQLFKSFSRNDEGTILTPDRLAVVELLDDFLDHPHEERAARIAQLTQFKNSPIVISELVHWLEFKPNLKSTPKPAPGEKQHGHEDYPSAVALAQFGPAAATQLVGDYLFYFENTDIDNNRKRMFRKEEKDERGVQKEAQDPSVRLALITTVLSLSPETARKAVEYTQKRSHAPAADARVQRGCQTLIKDIVSRFPESDRAELFPRLER